MQEALQDENFAFHLIFSDKATFHLISKVNRHNFHICGMSNHILKILTSNTLSFIQSTYSLKLTYHQTIISKYPTNGILINILSIDF